MSMRITQRSNLTFQEVAGTYPDIPRLLILKTDVQRRGVHYTEQALSVLDPELHSITGTHIFGTRLSENLVIAALAVNNE